jgi:hypothetical protein
MKKLEQYLDQVCRRAEFDRGIDTRKRPGPKSDERERPPSLLLRQKSV